LEVALRSNIFCFMFLILTLIAKTTVHKGEKRYDNA